MANNNDQLMHFSIHTPRQDPQESSGRPLAAIEGNGAGGDPVHGNVHRSDGAGGDSMRIRQAQGLPASFNPARERSVTPRRGAPQNMLRGGSSPPERERALGVIPRVSQRQMPSSEQFWMECTENALRVQKQRCEEVASSYMLETKQAFQSERAAW